MLLRSKEFKISPIFVVNQYLLWLILRKRYRERSRNEILRNIQKLARSEEGLWQMFERYQSPTISFTKQFPFADQQPMK